MRTLVLISIFALACDPPTAGSPAPTVAPGNTVTDIKDAAFTDRTPACSHYVGTFEAVVQDVQRNTEFTASVEITAGDNTCTLASNGIPNHDFNVDGGFRTPVAEVNESFNISAAPEANAAPTELTLQYDNAVFRNGVKLDLLAAACYGVGPDPLGSEKIGCGEAGQPWRYDPMHPSNDFGEDANHAHTQPDGAYHYHGDPLAMYDLSGSQVSGVIGWAADGFPIFGPFIDDAGSIRRVRSGYALKSGNRVSQDGEGAFPGGSYDGTFRDDWEYTGTGDLDRCNGMTLDGQYGYYVTDTFPWVLGCFQGTPDQSFQKAGPG